MRFVSAILVFACLAGFADARGTLFSKHTTASACTGPNCAYNQPTAAFAIPEAQTPPASAADVNQQILAIVNAERAKAGLAPLSADPNCCTTSISSVTTMSRTGILRHSGHDSVIGHNQSSPSDIVGSWMRSPGHRAALMDPNACVAGFAMANSRTGPFWAGTLRPLAVTQSTATQTVTPTSTVTTALATTVREGRTKLFHRNR